MKILLSTSLPLRPFFERLLPASPHEVELLCFEEEMPVPELPGIGQDLTETAYKNSDIYVIEG